MAKNLEAIEFEDILVEVGDYGKYQRRLVYFFLGPSTALLPWIFMNTLFLISSPDHWCNVPELDAFNLTLEQQKILIRPPSDPKCSMYMFNYSEVLESTWNWTVPEGTPTMACKNGYMYDKTNYDATAVTKWDMVCDYGHYPSLVLTLYNVGAIIGTPIYGVMSDKIGRKPTFFLTVIVALVSGIGSMFMNTFIGFLVFRTINGSIMPSIFQVPFIILTEIVGPTMRTRMNGIANNSWTFGLCFLPLIAWLCRDFFIFGLITSSVTVIFIAFYKLLPESPRWLLSAGRYEESATILADIAKRNGNPHTREELLALLKKIGDREKKERELAKNKNNANVISIFKSFYLRKYFFIITSCWIACGAAYYGLQINVPNLGGNEFLNFFFLSIVEIPGFVFAWYFMERIGRRWCSVSMLGLTGIALLVPVFMDNSGVAPSLIGKFGSSAGFMAVYQQSSELYPTVLRAIGMGLSGTVHCAITIGVPYVVYLAEYGKFIPFLIIAIVCLAAGSGASFLPETLNESLPQTVLDADNFGKSQSYCSCTKRRRPSCYEPRASIQHVNGEEIKANLRLERISISGDQKAKMADASNDYVEVLHSNNYCAESEVKN